MLSACGGKHANYGDGVGAGIGTTELEPTYHSIKSNIFQTRCLGCHSAGGTAAAVPLGDLTQMIQSPREIVLPGNAEESGVVIAIKRTDSRQMPPAASGLKRLDQEEISCVEQWIQEGAKP